MSFLIDKIFGLEYSVEKHREHVDMVLQKSLLLLSLSLLLCCGHRCNFLGNKTENVETHSLWIEIVLKN